MDLCPGEGIGPGIWLPALSGSQALISSPGMNLWQGSQFWTGRTHSQRRDSLASYPLLMAEAFLLIPGSMKRSQGWAGTGEQAEHLPTL